jgi:hypothetical protein
MSGYERLGSGDLLLGGLVGSSRASLPNLRRVQTWMTMVNIILTKDLRHRGHILTRIFRFDTNDPDAWTVVNDFLLDLRFRGYCVILIHHSGKNNTQRGLTMGDDNLDVLVQLEAPYGEAQYTPAGEWQIREDERLTEVRKLVKDGKSVRTIAAALDMPKSTAHRLVRQVEAGKLRAFNAKGVPRLSQAWRPRDTPHRDRPKKPEKARKTAVPVSHLCMWWNSGTPTPYRVSLNRDTGTEV